MNNKGLKKMKEVYTAPTAEIVSFQIAEDLLTEPGVSGVVGPGHDDEE